MKAMTLRVMLALLFLLGSFVGGYSADAPPTGDQQAQPVAVAALLVKFAPGLTAEEQSAVIARNGGIEKSAIPALRLRVVEVPAADLNGILQNLRSDAQVERVELNQRRQAEAAPSDTMYPQQWHLPKIGWDSVFGRVGTRGVAKVAVLDSGVDGAHPELASKVLPGTSILDGSNGLVDSYGHGTWLAGLIAAATDDGTGVAGVAYEGVRIVPVTVLGADGNGDDSDVIAGVLWAADNGADVILMGFSNPGFSQNLQDAIDYAWSRGVVLVAATGNGGVNGYTFPAGHRGVVGVSATGQDDSLDPSSNYGPDTFLAAPGADLYTTNTPDGGHTVISGTSGSAAIVAGVAAFMKAVDPTLTNGVIVGRLARTADPAGTQEETGNGRVNMARALADTGTDPIQPSGAPPVGDGGPFVGPYVAAAASISLNPAHGLAGVTVRMTGTGFRNPKPITVKFDSVAVSATNVDGGGACATTNNGNFLCDFAVPVNGTAGAHTVSAADGPVGGGTRTATAQFSVDVAKTDQTITFAPLADKTYGDEDFTVSATTSSGLTVIFAATGSCTVTGTTVHLTRAGSCTITASQAGDADYNAATDVAQSFTVNKAATTTTVTVADATYDGNPHGATASVTGAGGLNQSLTVSYAGRNGTTYGPSATAPTNAGDYTASASYAETSSYAASSNTKDFSIAKASQSITFDPLAPKNYGDTDFTVSATASSGLTVSFAANGSCTVTGTTVHLTGPGSCTITASQGGDANYNAATDVAQSFTVNKAATTTTVTVADATYDGNPHGGTASVTGAGGLNQNLTVSYAGRNGTTYGPSETAPTNAGDYTASASYAETSNYAASSNTKDFSIAKASQTITFGGLGNKAYGDADFSVSATASSGLTVSFAASGSCTVTGTTVHLTAGGSCTITASQVGDGNYKAATDVPRSFTVNKAATTTTVTVSDATYDGNPHGGTASVTGAGGLNQSLTVSYAGRNGTTYGPSATAPTNAGDYTASASYAETGNYAASSGTKDFSIAKAVQTITFAAPSDQIYGDPPFTVSATASSGLAVSFTVVSGPATVSGNTVTLTGLGMITLRATQAGNGNFNAAPDVNQSFESKVDPSRVQAPASISVPATSTTTSVLVGWGASPTDGATYVLERSLNGGTFGAVYSGAALSVTINGMGNGSYTFRLKAVKSGLTDSPYVSGTCVGTLTVTPPGSITVPATDNDGSFTVNWTNSTTSGVTYVLERSSDTSWATENTTTVYSGTALSYAITPALGSGTYYFRVKATKSNYTASTYVTSAACQVNATPIDAPASISVPTLDHDGAFTVSWAPSSVAGVTYKLERQVGNGAFEEIYSGGATSYAVTGLGDGIYRYQVKATKTGYVQSAYTTPVTCTVEIAQVLPPASIDVPATSTGTTLTVNWGASTTPGATYKLERSLGGGAFGVVYSGSELTATVTGMGNGDYVFRVRAVKTDWVDSADVSAPCKGELTATPPGSITLPSNDTDGTFSVSWALSSTPGVTYVVERYDNGVAYGQVYTGTAPSFMVNGVPDGSYVFKVKAVKTNYVDSPVVTSAACNVTVQAVGTPASITVPATDTDGAFTVSWEASALPGVTYTLERSDNGLTFAEVYSGTATSYAASNLDDGSYVYRVKATKSGYLPSGWAESRACVVTITAADPPTAIPVTPTDTDGAFTVSWGQSPMGGVTYKLEQSTTGGFVQVYSGTNLSYAVSGLSNGTYTFRVKATKSGYGDSTWVVLGTCTVTITAAEPPASITVPSSGTTTSLTVSWEASPTIGATYVLERSLGGGAFGQVYSGSGTTTTVNGMGNGSYVFQVKAVVSGYADSTYTTSTPCVVTLTATPPGSITVPPTDTDGAFTVNWTASTTSGVTYVLERSTDISWTTNITQVYNGTALSYAVTPALESGTYYFRVKATKTGYTASSYVDAACTVDATPIDAPASIGVPANDGDGAFTVSWTASVLVPGVTYKLERSDDGGSSFNLVYSGGATSYAVNGLLNGSYVFRVKATKTGYLESDYATSQTCTVGVATVEPPASFFVPAASTATTLTVSWEASPTPGVTYKLERSLNGGAFGQVYSGTALTATVAGMGNGTYRFRVKATKTDYLDSSYLTSAPCQGTLTALAPATITVPATDADGKFTVSWAASATSGVTYVLERSSDNWATTPTQIYSGTALSYAFTTANVHPNGSYQFRVKATKSNYVASGYTTSGTCVVGP